MTTVLGLVDNQRDVRELVGRLRAGLHRKNRHKQGMINTQSDSQQENGECLPRPGRGGRRPS